MLSHTDNPVLKAVRAVTQLPKMIIATATAAILSTVFTKHKGYAASVHIHVWRDWVRKRWGYSTTFPGNIVYHSERLMFDRRTTDHEMHHEDQYAEDATISFVLGVIVGLISWSFLLFMFVAFSFPLWTLVRYVHAFLLYGSKGAYSEALNEKVARAVSEGNSSKHAK